MTDTNSSSIDQPGMTRDDRELPEETPPKLTDNEQAMLNLAKIHPEYNNNQLATQLMRLGQIQSVNPVYNALKKNEYLSLEITKLRERIREDHTRNIFPLARNELKRALKSKDLHLKDKMPFVKLAYDKELKDEGEKGISITQINIEQLQAIVNTNTQSN